jgi:flagellar hook-length control protein FliK
MSPLAGQGAANPLATPAPVAMTLATPMTQANWGGAVAERVVWMTNANMQEAEIQLHPRELGPIGIKITVQNEQTHVSFVAHHATTREALEAALPRLREMLSDNGLQPGSTDVSQHSFREREGQADGGSARGGSALADGSLEGDEHLLGDLMRGVGYANPSGVDAFA